MPPPYQYRTGAAPPPRVPVRIRLISSPRAALVDHPPPRKKMCGALDPRTSKGSNAVECSCGARVCPVLASRGTYGLRSCPYGCCRMPRTAHSLGPSAMGPPTGRCLPGADGADHAWTLCVTARGACRQSQPQAFDSALRRCRWEGRERLSRRGGMRSCVLYPLLHRGPYASWGCCS
jgi:hypothetical protein